MMSIEDLWHKYQDGIQTKAGTISLETSKYIAGLVARESPQSACDIGSGFTSHLLRSLGIPEVVTYEADPRWAGKLDGLGYDIRPIGKLGDRTFDLVIVDSNLGEGSGWDRTCMPDKVKDIVNPGGYIVFDDYNWLSLFGAIHQVFEVDTLWPVTSLEHVTRDKYQRYAGLVGPCGQPAHCSGPPGAIQAVS